MQRTALHTKPAVSSRFRQSPAQHAALARHLHCPGQTSLAACRRARVIRTWYRHEVARHITACSAAHAAETKVEDGSVSVVLLAGGVGKRMGASIPKQYLELRGKPIAVWSFETFAAMRAVGEIIIVCDPSWRHVFDDAVRAASNRIDIKYALPGNERQDSVHSGLQEVRDGASLVAVHDSARPLAIAADIEACALDALRTGAAVLGVPVKPTIKEVGDDGLVIRTLQRSMLWEVQTPQIIRPQLLRDGFKMVAEKGLEVTDDVSIIEAMGLPVKITKGSYTNIKVTTPDDMSVAERFLDEQQKQRELVQV